MKRILVIITTILMMSSALFASYKESLALFEKKKYSESLAKIAAELDVSRDMEPDSPNYKLRYLAAHNHWKMGNTQSAVAHFKRCIDIKKDVVDPCIDLALLLMEKKLLNDADIYARKALTIKENAMSFYIMGSVSHIRKNYWRAKQLYEKAISLDPEFYAAYNMLGIALIKLSRYNQANTAFSAANAMAPPSAEILNNIGISLEKMGKPKEAQTYFKKAIALDPDNPVIKMNIERIAGKIQ